MSTDYDRLRTILVTMAELHPEMPLHTVMPLLDQVEEKAKVLTAPSTILTQADHIAFARSLARVTDPLIGGQMIVAIKELRAATGTRSAAEQVAWGGLRECKTTIEMLKAEMGL